MSTYPNVFVVVDTRGRRRGRDSVDEGRQNHPIKTTMTVKRFTIQKQRGRDAKLKSIVDNWREIPSNLQLRPWVGVVYMRGRVGRQEDYINRPPKPINQKSNYHTTRCLMWKGRDVLQEESTSHRSDRGDPPGGKWHRVQKVNEPRVRVKPLRVKGH